MKKALLVSILVFLTALSFLVINSFKESQLKHSRVQQAYLDKGECIQDLLQYFNINNVHLYLRAFKAEEKLEVWGKNKNNSQYKLITSYPFCSNSGVLGPKRQRGDYQIPEGFYEIDKFNPESNFHLSLGINYPNLSDKILSNASNLGGDIFIHGACATVGCIPITDDWIEELYILAVEARDNGQLKIPIHIFPSYLNDHEYQNLIEDATPTNDTSKFWLNLKEGYDYFEKNHRLPTIEIADSGKYIIN